MLRVNLRIQGKLVNGSLGTLKAIVYKHGICPSELPLYVLVEFNEYHGKCIYSKCFPIIAILKLFMKRGIKCYRKKLPLVLGHAFSIYKDQGLN